MPHVDRHGPAPVPAGERARGCRPNHSQTTTNVSAVVFISVACAAGWLADRMTSGRMPYGAGAATLAALVVRVLVGRPLGDLGPHLVEVAGVPAAAGALTGAVILRLALARMV